MNLLKKAHIAPVLISFALSTLLLAAKEPELQKLWQIHVTQEYAGAPQKSVIPVSIWALAFSPDGRFLAFAAGFIESNKPIESSGPPLGKTVEYPFKSYVFVVDSRQPEVSRKRFELQMPPNLNRPTMMWSPSGDSIGFQSVSLLGRDHEIHLLRTTDGMNRSVDVGTCNLKGLLDGLRLIAECYESKDRKTYMRFFSADGTVEREFEVPGFGSIKAIDAGSARLVLNKSTPASPSLADRIVAPHEMILVGLDGKEERRWTLPGAEWYDGVFAESGKRFCVVSRVPVGDKAPPALTCWSVSTGEQLSRLSVNYRLSTPDGIQTGGLRIGMPEADVHAVPAALQRLAETSFYYGPSHRVIYDLETGKKLAEWEPRTQHLLPKPATEVIGGYPYSIASDGNMMAEGGEGVVTLYRLR
jgi:hypothetical protein